MKTTTDITCAICAVPLTGGRDTFDVDYRQFCAVCRFEENDRIFRDCQSECDESDRNLLAQAGQGFAFSASFSTVTA